jgi:uncharacterized membrane protein
MFIAIFIITFIVSAILCHSIAMSRGANAVFWGVMGAIFGPLAIPFVFLSKPGPQQ